VITVIVQVDLLFKFFVTGFWFHGMIISICFVCSKGEGGIILLQGNLPCRGASKSPFSSATFR
jgi:hypothetical protein